MGNDGCLDRGAADQGLADSYLVAFAYHQHLVQHHGAADVAGNGLDFQGFTGGNTVLLATSLDYCVHNCLALNAVLQSRALYTLAASRQNGFCVMGQV